MKYPALEKYLARLNDTVKEESRVWLDAQGRAQGKYFNTTLTSAFQPIRVVASPTVTPATVIAHEGFARSYSQDDTGLHLWRLLDQAASEVQVDLIGGFSAFVQKGVTPGERALIDSLPAALTSSGKSVCAI